MSAAEGTESIAIGDRRLSWRRVGEGDPLLLVNGYAATALDWDPTFLAGLAEHFDVLCPDNRGFGASELGDLEAETLGIDSMAADLDALLDAVGIDRLPVVGWSMGGFVAQRLAERGRAASLTLLATDPGGPTSTPADDGVWTRLTDHTGTPREQASRLISLLFPAEFATQVDREFGDVVAAARGAIDPAALSAQETAMAAWHDGGQPPRTVADLPVLVISGTEDEVIPAANASALAARYPGADIELRPGCGHGMMAQEPAELAALVAAFSASSRR